MFAGATGISFTLFEDHYCSLAWLTIAHSVNGDACDPVL